MISIWKLTACHECRSSVWDAFGSCFAHHFSARQWSFNFSMLWENLHQAAQCTDSFVEMISDLLHFHSSKLIPAVYLNVIVFLLTWHLDDRIWGYCYLILNFLLS
jgi:hypothetical protein